MKKIFLYTMLACMAVSFGSCSDDPMDATEKHVLITLSFLLLIRTYPKRKVYCLNTL